MAHQRPRSALILNIQQENRHIRELQQENRELKLALEEHQNTLESMMHRYRQQLKRMDRTVKEEQAWVDKDFKPVIISLQKINIRLKIGCIYSVNLSRISKHSL